MTFGQSPQDFVRALKAPTDPPTSGGPPKIIFAQQAWDDTSFYVPNKAEVIVNWILNKLLKEKGKGSPLNPMLDIRFWGLLKDILSEESSPSENNHRSPKSWLPSVLGHIPTAPILIQFLKLMKDVDAPQKQLLEVTSSCFSIIWSSAVQKMGTETLLECVGAFLSSLELCEHSEGLACIGTMVVSSYRNSLMNCSNKKKIYLTLVQSFLPQWLESFQIEAHSEPYKEFLNALYDAGIDTLFNLEVLRQFRDAKFEVALLETIATIASSKAHLLICLPRIFLSYIHATRKNRGSLFSQGSDQAPSGVTDEFKVSAMRFFVSCQPLLDDRDVDIQKWETRVALLSLVGQENIFTRKQLDGVAILNQIAELAIGVIEKSCSANYNVLSIYAIETLSALIRIDYDFISSALPRVILALILMNNPSQPFYEFLGLLLEYHAKTRTINSYVSTILAAASACHTSPIADDTQSFYLITQSGPVMNHAHLEPLSKSIQSFLSSAQATSMVRSVSASINNAWEELCCPQSPSDLADLAIRFSLSTRIAVVVFGSLPLRSASKPSEVEIRQLSDNAQDSASKMLIKALKRLRKKIQDDGWALQIIAMASLRLRYVLDIPSSSDTILDQSSNQLYSKMADLLDVDGLLPEFRYEIFQTLLGKTALRTSSDTQATIDHVLRYIEKNDLADESSIKKAGSLSLLHMVIERMLPIFESVGSPEQLKRLLRIIMSINLLRVPGIDTSGLLPYTLLAQMLHSASFWEYSNIRTAFLASLSDFAEPSDYLKNIPAVSNIFRILLTCPLEYISRSCRAELIERTIAVDTFLMRSWARTKVLSNDNCETLIMLRVFLCRAAIHGGLGYQSVTQLCEYSTCLSALDHASTNSELVSATSDLMEVIYLEVFQQSTTSHVEMVPTLLKFLNQIGAEIALSGDSGLRPLRIAKRIEVLVKNFHPDNFPPEIRSALQIVHRNVSALVYTQISEVLSRVTSRTAFIEYTDSIGSWSMSLSFGTWLGVPEPPPLTFGRRLLQTILKIHRGGGDDTKAWDRILVGIFAILVQELPYISKADTPSHLTLVTAGYVTFSRIVDTDSYERLDAYFSKMCKTLPPLLFSHVLGLVEESLTKPDTPAEELSYLIKCSTLLLRDHPGATLKYTQNHTDKCLNTFASYSLFTEGPILLRLQVLNFIAQNCSDRASALRVVDLGNIWVLLGRLLSGSQVHDSETTVDVFHKIVTIVSSLVRFRRDLVTLTLPHLGIILRRLFMAVRSVRPLLGPKQTALVTDTLPRWVNSKYPLGPEEGKALARLLETLLTKSIVRNNACLGESQKAESLAKPFSKHAAYVAKAYIEAMNDPLVALRHELRKELQRGLYALCNLMNDYSRDSIMASALDVGGRTTLKTLWREYEKQRYAGKG